MNLDPNAATDDKFEKINNELVSIDVITSIHLNSVLQRTPEISCVKNTSVDR